MSSKRIVPNAGRVPCLDSAAIGPFILVALVGTLLAGGCNRSFYRRQADREVSEIVVSKAQDPRWEMGEFTIEPDRKSRMFDPFCPDQEPMPPDDPTSHQLIHWVDGKKGSKHWADYGTTPFVESPDWRTYLPVNQDGVVVLDRNAAVELALIHSRDYQQRLENLYLAALDVSAERYRFDVQFFGDHSTVFTADGPDRAGGPSSGLEVDHSARATRLLATGAELLVGFANSMVWEFSGSHTYASTSLLDFSIIQPLLRGGGRAVVLENLTDSERALLANVRQFERFRKGFFLQIVSGTSSGAGPSSGSLSIGSLTPSASAGRSGVLGLLQSQVQIRNQEQNVAGLQDSYEQLLAAHEAQRIDRFQVDLALQSLFEAQSSLLELRNRYESSLDSFKITIGLPPDVEVEISDPVLEMFDLIAPALFATQDAATELSRKLRDPDNPLPADWLEQLADIWQQTHEHVEMVERDLSALAEALPERRRSLRHLYSQEDFGPEAEQAIESLEQRYEAARAGFEELVTGVSPEREGPFREEMPVSLSERLAELEAFLADPQAAVEARRAEVQKELDEAQQELERTRQAVEAASAAIEEAGLDDDVGGVEQRLADVRAEFRLWQSRVTELENDLKTLEDNAEEELALDLLEPLLVGISDLTLIQARARLDRVTLPIVDVSPEQALEIARSHRLDWMNARAALVDRWRQIHIAANDLRSSLDVTFSGDMSTIGDNPVAFRGTTGRMRVGLEFDAPFERLLERNAYRRALIDYQRARREYYEFEDRVYQGLRDVLRNIRLGQLDFELRRDAVVTAIAQVDQARERLRAPPRPGETSTFGATTARDLVQALSGLLRAQNQFLGGWVEYEIDRMLLDFQMGTMQLDDRGLWIDPGPITEQTLEGPPGAGPAVPTLEEILQIQPLPEDLSQNEPAGVSVVEQEPPARLPPRERSETPLSDEREPLPELRRGLLSGG